MAINLAPTTLNVVISILGFFILAFGAISIKIKQVWYLGEALPAVVFGAMLGPMAARWLDARMWGMAIIGQVPAITLGMTRLVIGIQLVIAGFQLPARFLQYRYKEMLICLLPVMTIMWLCTTVCIIATVPKITLLAALVIGSCVTCTDPILSQAVAKGPFSDKYVRRNLRELISAEAGANDGFGFPFLMLATYLIRHAESPELSAEIAENQEAVDSGVELLRRGMELLRRATEGEETSIGRLGGGVSQALANWGLETWLYAIVMSAVYGTIVGWGMMYVARFALKKRWIDGESYLMLPTGIGLFIIGTCGMLATDDLLACFIAGTWLNWDGQYLKETEARHDEVNSVVDVLLNFGGFMYIGAVIPWSSFQDPDGTGVTIPRLLGLGIMIVLFRRIPAILMAYKFMPNCVTDWKEALFMGYFGPIGIGAVFYGAEALGEPVLTNHAVEHTRHLFPEPGEALTDEENDLTAAMIPVVYWLVVFSIFWHGLSIPALNLIYKWKGVEPIQDEDGPTVVRQLSSHNPLPKNSSIDERRQSIVLNNRFSRSYNTAELDMNAVESYRRRTQQWYKQQDAEAYASDKDIPKDSMIQWTQPSPHYQPALRRSDTSKSGPPIEPKGQGAFM